MGTLGPCWDYETLLYVVLKLAIVRTFLDIEHIEHIDGFLEQQFHFQSGLAQSALAPVLVARSLPLFGGWIAGSVYLIQSEISGYGLG